MCDESLVAGILMDGGSGFGAVDKLSDAGGAEECGWLAELERACAARGGWQTGFFRGVAARKESALPQTGLRGHGDHQGVHEYWLELAGRAALSTLGAGTAQGADGGEFEGRSRIELQADGTF